MSGQLHSHQYLIGIDSDGCVFDNMTIKHQRCFGPAFIEAYGLETVAEQAAEVWDFVNLFSRTRGCNRFKGVIHSIHWLEKWPGVDIDLPSVAELEAWADSTASLSNASLEQEIAAKPESAGLKLALEWSFDVNRRIGSMDASIPPIEGVQEAFSEAAKQADLAVISQAPQATVEEEWGKYHIDSEMARVCGQEFGSKAKQLSTTSDGFYKPEKMLLIGDAPGDRAAAEECNALFFPIISGEEEESWKELRLEALPRFFAGSYAGAYQDARIETFQKALPLMPHWGITCNQVRSGRTA